jgi:hypothetical protein
VSGRSRPRDKTLRVARLISKCGEHALEEEHPDPSAKQSKGLHLHSRHQNWTSGRPAALTPQRKDEPMQVELHFAFESARFQRDSTKSNGARSFLGRRPGCGHDGNTVPQGHHHDLGKARRSVRRPVFPAKETQQRVSHSLKHTPGYPSTRKAQSPLQIASRLRSCSFQLTSSLRRSATAGPHRARVTKDLGAAWLGNDREARAGGGP